MLRNLVVALFQHLKIETTVAKAKETKRLAERIITLGKKGDLHSRRLALTRIPNKNIIAKLFGELAPKIERSSGYLRVIKTHYRTGDCADMAILEFVDYDLLKGEKKEEKKERKKKSQEKAGKKKKEEEKSG